MKICLFHSCFVPSWIRYSIYTNRIHAFTWSKIYGSLCNHYVSFTWITYMSTRLIRKYYVSFLYNWWKIMYYTFKWSFQSWVFSLLTTSLVCSSAQGAIVHKPRRRAATAIPHFSVNIDSPVKKIDLMDYLFKNSKLSSESENRQRKTEYVSKQPLYWMLL